MLQLPSLKPFSSLMLAICLVCYPLGTSVGDEALPSVDVLERTPVDPVASPNLTGLPTYEDLLDVLDSFSAYIRGSAIVAKHEEPVLTRGAMGVSLFRRLSPAVVLVVAAKFTGDQVSEISEGTGVIVDPRGYVLTNSHVLAGYDSALVFLKPAGKAVPQQNLAFGVRLVNYDASKDLALLKMITTPTTLVGAELTDIAKIEVGQDIHVIGHPGGSEHAWSYTTGVVSQIRRNYAATYSSGQRLQADLVQIQTAVNPGNSGGPVFDDSGKVIGLVTFGFTEMQNLNFAVAVDEISRFLTLSYQMATRGSDALPHNANGGTKGEFFLGKLGDGRKVLRARFPDLTVFLVQNASGKWLGLVAKSNSGLVLRAWEPGITGGFNQWQLTLKDGTTVMAKGRAGLPEVFGGS